MQQLITLSRALQLAADTGNVNCETAEDCYNAGVLTFGEYAGLLRNVAARAQRGAARPSDECGHNDEFINADGAVECADCGVIA